jgi:hypothetical protein
VIIMCEKSDLGWKLCTYRRMPQADRYPFVRALVAGTRKVPSPATVAREKAAWVKSLRAHPKCREHAAQYDHASFADAPGYTVGPNRCECCGDVLDCAPGHTDHEPVEISAAEARSRGIYHGGNCYHVTVCKHCGGVSAYDSSD